MYPFSRIVFPVDFSKRCEAVVPAVRAMAAKHNSGLVLFHALDMPPGGYAEWYSFAAVVDLPAIREHTVRSLDRFAERLFQDVPVETVISDGRPVDALAEFVKERPDDLIMLPSHGHGKFRSMLLGSVTTGVLHEVANPVWTAAHALEEPPPPSDYRNIVCAIDMERNSLKALDMANRIAKDYGANLRVIHSEPAVEDLVHSDSAMRFRRFLEFRAREDYEPLAAEAGVTAAIEVVEGPVGESIASACKSRDADLLVIGRGVVHGTFGNLRTHITDIIRRAPCPVITV